MASDVKTSAPIDGTHVACESFKPIYWSAKDTRSTQDQATEHNAVGKRLCKWGT